MLVLLIIDSSVLLSLLLAMQCPTNSLDKGTNGTFWNSELKVKILLKIHFTFSINNTSFCQNVFILREVEFRVFGVQLRKNIGDSKRLGFCIVIRRVWDCLFDATWRLVGRTGARKGVVGDIDMDGLRSQICGCLLGTSMACLFMETVQREDVGGYDTFMVNIGVIFLMRELELLSKIEATGKAYELLCPEHLHLQSQLNVVLRILRADITPAVCTWMFGALKFLLHNSPR